MSVGVSILPHHKSTLRIVQTIASLEIKKRMCIRDGTSVVAYFFFQVGLSDLAVERRYDVNIDVYVRVSFFLYGECGELTSIWTSNQSRIPAEFKHITRRRKRN